jgi:hypothetical protein
MPIRIEKARSVSLSAPHHERKLEQRSARKLIERVRALLAIDTKNGCTEAEAMTAAALAAKLMHASATNP